MRKTPIFAAVMTMAALAWAGGPASTPAPNKAPAKRAATAAVVKKAPVNAQAAKPMVAKKPVASAAAIRRGRKSPAPRFTTSWRNRQSAPTPDRYREIQEALVEKGYLSSEDATGTWGPSSADALKKFQAEQTLDTTGKIDSLSLIALGLGPKHDTTVPRLVDGNFVQAESGRN
jgi:hypothetical protein